MLPTPRLLLFPATVAALEAELDSPAALGTALGADVPAEWPPEHYDADAVRWMRDQTRDLVRGDPGAAGWGAYYLAERPAGPGGRPRLVGAGGYKGPPAPDGTVEVGYSVLPAFQRRGYAREAVAAWLARAFADPRVTAVLAHTLEELVPSVRVLEATGFRWAPDPREEGAIMFALTRAEYAARTR